MDGKRKRVVLTLEEKLYIIECLEKETVSAIDLAKIYGVGKSTIYCIKKQKDDLMKYDGQVCLHDERKRKTLKKAGNTKLDDAVFQWFVQENRLGQRISGPLLCEKALQLNQMLGGPASFMASTGWLKNFKMRHGIRQLTFQGDLLSADSSVEKSFKLDFLKMIDGYPRERIYNAYETAIHWKAVPRKLPTTSAENSSPTQLLSLERLTVIVAANSSGTHALPLYMIGASGSPRCCASSLSILPAVYRSQKSALVNSALFKSWYLEEFIPSVKEHQRKKRTEGKTLLMLDIAPCHSSAELLNREAAQLGHADFTVCYFPPNVASLIQPMIQGVIQKLKRLYRKEMLIKFRTDVDAEQSLDEVFKKFDLKECCSMLAHCWNNVTQTDLSQAWRKLLPAEADEDTLSAEEEHPAETYMALLQEIPGFSGLGYDVVDKWLNIDVDDDGYQVLNAEEIVAQIIDDDANSNNGMEKEIPLVPKIIRPSCSEALSALDTAMQWYEVQEECTSDSLMFLRQLRDLAAFKSLQTEERNKPTLNK